MQKESSLFFSFPSDKDSKLVSLGSSKNFGKAKVTKKREKCKRKARFSYHCWEQLLCRKTEDSADMCGNICIFVGKPNHFPTLNESEEDTCSR